MSATFVTAQNSPRSTEKSLSVKNNHNEPLINYVLTINKNDLSAYTVEMHIKNVPDTFQIAMVRHFEYDDRFWRYLKDLKAEPGKIIREDSALWKVITVDHQTTISYRIVLPEKKDWRGSWQPFLSSNGALVGGPHSFLYVVDHTSGASTITLNIPTQWTIATGLIPASDKKVFYASSVYMLTDEPILAGMLKNWSFYVEGISHNIAYYPLPISKSFDTVMLARYTRKIVEEARNLFGSLPYKNYTFLLQDGSYGGLEHSNSVELGATAKELAEGFTDFLSEAAHEYFHTWNLVRIRPAEYGDVTYQATPLSKELWWSEGLTMFYADLLLRRAGLAVNESTRIKHLEQLIGSYYSEAGNYRISAEKVSLAANAEPGMLGDYSASTHLQGELIGTMLDILIRSNTNNHKSIDNVMRLMNQHFNKQGGFTNNNLEQIISKVCGCNMHLFFKKHISGSKPLNFNKYLRLIGLRVDVKRKEALGNNNKPAPDIRVYAWQNHENKLLLGITDAEGCWAKAGLHTNDEIIALNNKHLTTQKEFFSSIRSIEIGDTISFEVKRSSGPFKTNVIVSEYERALATIEDLPGITLKERKLQQHWLKGD